MSFSKRLFVKNDLEEGAFAHFLERNNEDGETLFWRLNLVIWGVIGVFAFFLMVPMLGLKSAIIVAPARTLSGFGAVLLLRAFYRRIPWRRLRFGALMLMVSTVCLILALVESRTSEFFLVAVIGNPPPKAWQPVLPFMGIVIRFIIFSTWSMFYFAVRLWSDSLNAKLQLARSETESRTAELRQLQAQVNPHFLFNALNSILAERSDPAAVERIGQSLADYLRYSLRHQHGFVPLGDELDQLDRFLQVERVRFEERLEYAIEADAAARAVPVPPAFAQPLLENACKYGRKTSPRVLRIRITARREGHWLEVAVANTGHWCEEAVTHSTGTGLANLRRRIELLSRGRAGLTHYSADGQVTATLHWPLDIENARPEVRA